MVKGERSDSSVLAGLRVGERYVPGDYRFSVAGDGSTFTLVTEDDERLQIGTLGDSIGSAFGLDWIATPEVMAPRTTIEFSLAGRRDVATELARDLGARLDRDGNLLRLSLVGPRAEKVAAVVNAAAQRFTQVAMELKREQLDTIAAILEGQRRYAEERLRVAEEALQRFRVETATLPTERGTPVTPGLEETRGPAFSHFWRLRQDLEQIKDDRETIERALAPSTTSGLAVEALEEVASRRSLELAAVLADLTEQRAELRVLLGRYSDQHPVVQEAVGRVRELEEVTIPNLARRLSDELMARGQELSDRIASASGELSQIPPRAIQEAGLESRVTTAEEFYTELQVRHEQALLAAANNIPDVRVLDAAVAPRRPVNSKIPMRLLVIALVGSFGLGLATVIVLDRMDPRLRYPSQVSQELGLPILGTVPHVTGTEGHAGLRSVMSVVESFRLIRLNVLHSHGSAGPVVIAITSPGSGDGKSLVAANLGLTFADLGRRTLVIDGDVRRGRLHRLLGGARKPGLTDVLAGDAPRELLMQPTQYRLLHRAPCGRRRQNGPELIQSSAMAALLTAFRSLYDVILIDTPPIGVGADALALSTLAGNTIVVLRTDATSRESTQTKLEFMENLPTRLLGAIINDVPTGALSGYAYYYTPYSSYLPGYEALDEKARDHSQHFGATPRAQDGGGKSSAPPIESPGDGKPATSHPVELRDKRTEAPRK
jgi:capsular exopolysaccharide synthesis family protein